MQNYIHPQIEAAHLSIEMAHMIHCLAFVLPSIPYDTISFNNVHVYALQIQQALQVETERAQTGHPFYDLNRHIALQQLQQLIEPLEDEKKRPPESDRL